MEYLHLDLVRDLSCLNNPGYAGAKMGADDSDEDAPLISRRSIKKEPQSAVAGKVAAASPEKKGRNEPERREKKVRLTKPVSATSIVDSAVLCHRTRNPKLGRQARRTAMRKRASSAERRECLTVP